MTTTTTSARPISSRTRDPHDAAALVAQLLADGYLAGVPPGLSAEARDIDARLARGMRCPRCRRRGCTYRPFHSGGCYRILAACRSTGCGGAEEL